MTTRPSGFYSDQVCGALRPSVQIGEWFHIGKPDPEPFRHIESGVFKPSAKNPTSAQDLSANFLRGGFRAQSQSGIPIDFGEVIPTSGSSFLTKTVALSLNMGEINLDPRSFFSTLHASSGVGDNFRAYNFRFFANNLNVFNQNTSLPTFYYQMSSGWIPNYSVNTATACVVPSGLPDVQNVLVKGTEIAISGSHNNADFTNYIYLAAEFPNDTYRLGTYGVSGFQFKFSYDYTSAGAVVRPTDSLPCGSGIAILPSGCVL